MKLHHPYEGDPREMAERSVEVWLPLPGSPSIFVSNLGNVYSVKRGRCRTWQNAKTGFISVYVKGRKKVYVHWLVLETFDSPRAGRRARRKNSNFQDNRLCNLYLA